jgi:hypothetical protein
MEMSPLLSDLHPLVAGAAVAELADGLVSFAALAYPRRSRGTPSVVAITADC